MFESTPGSPYRIPTLANLSIVVAQFAAIAGCFLAASMLHTWWQVVLLALAFSVLMNSVYSIIHEAEHAMLFPNRRWNDLAGMVLSLFFPAPFHLIRQGHLGHHLRNRSDDEAFDLYFEDDHVIWKHLVLYGILTGLYWVIVVLSNVIFLFVPFAAEKKFLDFDRPALAFRESLNPCYNRLIRIEGLAAILLHAAILATLRIPMLNYLAIYFAFGLSWSSMQYVHHYGTERHVTRGARNLWIFRPLDALWLNHNWHRTHHENPTVPWNHLPTLAEKQPAAESRRFLIAAYLRMWRGPQRATEHVRNKFAGMVIR